MGHLREAGTYRAAPFAWEIVEVGRDSLPVFRCLFVCSQWWDGAEWKDFQGADNEITGDFFIIKKDGNINDFAVDALSKALGWDGLSFASLLTGDWKRVSVQLVVGTEKDSKGHDHLRVKYLNPGAGNPRGTAPKLAADALGKLDGRYRSGLKLLAAKRAGKEDDLSLDEDSIPF